MFRSSSPFSLSDLDMWDTKSRFTAQTSAWCGMAAVSGTGFLSKVSASSSGSTAGLRQSDPGLRKWQSLSHLEHEGATRPFPPSPGAELRAARGDRSFRHAETGQWMLDAHESLTNRNSQLSYNKMAAHLDVKQKFSGAMRALEQEKETAEFNISRQQGEFHEKVARLEKELLQMRSALGKGGSDYSMEKPPGSPSRTLPLSEEDLNKQESQNLDTELKNLREALREAEARVKTQEEERNQAMQKLKTSTETQKMLLNQMDEMNQKLSHMRQNQFEVQEQLSEANNKISQACLEKAILTTQVLKLEDNIKELRTKQAGDLSDKEKLIQEKAGLQQRNKVLELQLQEAKQGPDGCKNSTSQNNKQDQETVRIKGELKALQETNEKLTGELEVAKQTLKTSQSQLQEMTAERDVNSKLIADLKTECAQLAREKGELLCTINEDRHEELEDMKEKCSLLRESMEALESEKLKIQEQCLCLEAEVLEKEEMLQLQEEEHRKQEAARVQVITDLRAVASHWTEKWQKVALTLQATQEELNELKNDTSRDGLQTETENLEGQKNKKETDNQQQTKLETSKQEPDKSRSEASLHRYKSDSNWAPSSGSLMITELTLPDRCGEAVHTRDAETETDLSQSSLLREPPTDSQSSQNKSHKVKDDKSSVDSRQDNTVCAVNPETDHKRRLVTEQLKSLFKEREGKVMLTADSSPAAAAAAAQTGASSSLDRSNTSKVIKKAADRRVWQQGSGLMPVFEEDEESSEEEGQAKEETTEKNTINQSKQMPTFSAEINNLKAKHENLLQATIRDKQPTQQGPHNASDDSPSDEVSNMRPSFYPDGIFQAELVDVCSPDEEEEEQ